MEEPVLRKFVTLLAEDNHADALLIEEAIEAQELPIELHRVSDGQKAFDFIKRAEEDPNAPCPELLLLDLNLPKRSGREVLERVRGSQKCQNIPVLVITSSDSPKERAETAQLGISGYFRKQPSYQEFLKVGTVLKEILRQHFSG